MVQAKFMKTSPPQNQKYSTLSVACEPITHIYFQGRLLQPGGKTPLAFQNAPLPCRAGVSFGCSGSRRASLSQLTDSLLSWPHSQSPTPALLRRMQKSSSIALMPVRDCVFGPILIYESVNAYLTLAIFNWLLEMSHRSGRI